MCVVVARGGGCEMGPWEESGGASRWAGRVCEVVTCSRAGDHCSRTVAHWGRGGCEGAACEEGGATRRMRAGTMGRERGRESVGGAGL